MNLYDTRRYEILEVLIDIHRTIPLRRQDLDLCLLGGFMWVDSSRRRVVVEPPVRRSGVLLVCSMSGQH